MLACTAATTAVATAPPAASVLWIVKTAYDTPEAPTRDLLTAQIPPPPRA
jgi:hypothetical protein